VPRCLHNDQQHRAAEQCWQEGSSSQCRTARCRQHSPAPAPAQMCHLGRPLASLCQMGSRRPKGRARYTEQCPGQHWHQTRLQGTHWQWHSGTALSSSALDYKGRCRRQCPAQWWRHTPPGGKLPVWCWWRQAGSRSRENTIPYMRHWTAQGCCQSAQLRRHSAGPMWQQSQSSSQQQLGRHSQRYPGQSWSHIDQQGRAQRWRLCCQRHSSSL
jgi:hypothetical protein